MNPVILETLYLVAQNDERSVMAIHTLFSDFKSDSAGSTLLHFAAKCGNLNVVMYLLKKGIDIDARDNLGRTALMNAVIVRQEKVIGLLVIMGADVTIRDSEQKSAFQLFSADPEESVNALIALLVAVDQQCSTMEETAELLINAGVQLDQVVFLNKTALVGYLIKKGGFEVNSKNLRNGNTALHIAVQLGEVQTVQLLLEFGADINCLDNMARSPINYLHLSKIQHTEEKLEVLKILLNSGVSLTTCIHDGCFQCGSVLAEGNKEEIRIILQSYINFDVRDANGLSIIHYLALNIQPGVVKEIQLHAQKFDVNAVDIRGMPPLYMALSNGNVNMVEFLLELGADVNYRLMKSGSFPILFRAYVRSNEHSKELYDQCAELLLQKGADPQYVATSDDQAVSVFDLVSKEDSFLRMKPIVARLAMLERRGTPISEIIILKIEEHGLVAYLETCRVVLDETVVGDVTISQLLLDPITKLARYVDSDLVRDFESLHEMELYHRHYLHTVQKRLSNAMNYKGGVSAVCNIFGNVIDGTHLVVRKIMAKLTNKDMERLAEFADLYV